MSEKRDMSGTLGKNERRQKDSHPTHQGSCLIEGKAYWISGWVKEGQSGRFFSLAFKPKEEQAQSPRPSSLAAQDGAEFDDDIPF